MEDEQILTGTSVPEVSAAPKKAKPNIKAMTPEERREYNKSKTAKSRDKAKTKEARQRSQPTYAESTNAKEAKELLTQRIPTANVVDTCLRFGTATANLLGVPDNAYFWQKGPTAMLEDTLAELADDYPKGELLTRTELFYLYEYCAKGRKIIGQERIFEEWLELRFKTKTDLWFLCV